MRSLLIIVLLFISFTVLADPSGELIMTACRECHSPYSRVQSKIDDIDSKEKINKILKACPPYHELLNLTDHEVDALYQYLQQKRR